MRSVSSARAINGKASYGSPATAASNIFFTICRTNPSCSVYNPMVRKVRLESSRREPMTLRSDGSIADFSADSETIRLKLFKAHDFCKVKKILFES